MVFGQSTAHAKFRFVQIKVNNTRMSHVEDNASSAAANAAREDVSDSKKFSARFKEMFGAGSSSGGSAQSSTLKGDSKYDMDHARRGVAVIFNMEKFESRTLLARRNGTEQDVEALTNTLSDLNFKDIRIYNDLNKEDVMMYLEILSQEDHTEADCVLVAFLSHGERNTVFASDGSKIELEELHEPFTADRCTSLARKPKIFIIQACQGKLTDAGTLIKRSSDQRFSDDDGGSTQVEQKYRIPNRADFITVWSTVPRYVAFLRQGTGSWFIQTLTRVMDEHARSLDFLSLVTHVARDVAEKFDSNSTDPRFHDKKQVPYTMSTLTREIRF